MPLEKLLLQPRLRCSDLKRRKAGGRLLVVSEEAARTQSDRKMRTPSHSPRTVPEENVWTPRRANIIGGSCKVRLTNCAPEQRAIHCFLLSKSANPITWVVGRFCTQASFRVLGCCAEQTGLPGGVGKCEIAFSVLCNALICRRRPKSSWRSKQVLVNGRRFQGSGAGNRLAPSDRAIGVQRHLRQVFRDLGDP